MIGWAYEKLSNILLSGIFGKVLKVCDTYQIMIQRSVLPFLLWYEARWISDVRTLNNVGHS